MAKTKYEKLLTMKDNFTRAASKAENNSMKLMWTVRAEDVQRKLDKITLEEATKTIGE